MRPVANQNRETKETRAFIRAIRGSIFSITILYAL